MKAGFYESDITPFFDTHNTITDAIGYPMKGVHTPFSFTAGVFESEGRCVALVGADMILLDRALIDYAVEELKKRMPLDALLAGASHTHANAGTADWLMPDEDIMSIKDIKPDIRERVRKEMGRVDPEYRMLLRKRLVDAVFTAYQRRQDVRLVMGRAKVDNVAYNRRQKMKDGFTVTHAGKGNPNTVGNAGPVDTELVALGAVNGCGEMIGAVVNFGCHGTVSSEGFFSADWPYYMRETVKRNINPKMGVVFLNGCCGDVTQIDNIGVEDEPRTERRAMVLGERVGFGAVEALRAPLPENYEALGFKCEQLPLNYRSISEERYRKALEDVNTKYDMKKDRWLIGYYARDTVLLVNKMKKNPLVHCELNAVQIGNLLLLSSPGEVFAQMSLDLKYASVFPFTMVSELTNGLSGYIPTPDAFGPGGGGYEPKFGGASFLEVGAFEKIRAKFIDMMKHFKPERAVIKPAPQGTPWRAYRPDEL